ncbi:MAG: coproporphyrinogen III oxidase [Deltaproteobacteria bacterium HGW-Deltaproteobacteria-12]|nr:MAG: coproporphyrinogen III oxidase [Deltaproteobacteria bacterium HGW-Deltaproteobacteria-12]
MLNSIITKIARNQFARALKFEEEIAPALPSCSDNKQRLLYIHIPFCEELCPYCSFHRVRFDENLTRKYFRALTKEIKLYREKNFSFAGIYVGGGTPTILIDELAALLQYARSCFPIREISVETNPNHLTPGNISILQNAGVNRLSVGVQTFNDELLKKIGRFEKYGSGNLIAEKLGAIQGCFDTVNADMIFNFPSQTPQTLNDDLDILLKLNMEQITFYPLMVSTITQNLMDKTIGAVNFNREKKFYKLIARRLEQKYDYSSAWCFSRKKSKKTLIDEYVVDYDEYAGLGSGAIGYLQGVCYANTFDINGYISALDQNMLPLMASRRFSLHDQMSYDFLMKLFSTKINVAKLEEKYDGKFLKSLWKEMIACVLAGSFRYFAPHLYLTPQGRYYWVIMMREFFIAVNNFREFCRKQANIN